MKALIKKLVEAWGPSGFEHQVRELIRAEVASLADDIRVDAMGNLICRMGNPEGKRVMIAAHMDEIGLIVSHIDHKGYLRFSQVGVLYPYNLAHQRVKFENGTIGVISFERTGDAHKVPVLDKFYLDLGTEANRNTSIGVGDPATMWREMDEQGDHLIAKSMDDRIGCVVAIETMRQVKAQGSPHDLYFVFTTQEEVGTRGAITAAYGVKPVLGIALDVTATGDGLKGTHPIAVELGKGVAIKLMDAKHIVPPSIKNWMIETAQTHQIPYQLEILQGGTTDASVIQLTHEGVPSGTISIPCRYVHSPSEMVHLGDVQASIDLLAALLTAPISFL